MLNPKVFDRIEDDSSVWEGEPLQTIASQGELVSFQHEGLWKPWTLLETRGSLRASAARASLPGSILGGFSRFQFIFLLPGTNSPNCR